MNVDDALRLADECKSESKYAEALRVLATHTREKKEAPEAARSVLPKAMPKSNGVTWKQQLIDRYNAGEKLELAQLDAIGVRQ